MITIVTPTYNRVDLLKRAVQSVLDQKIENFTYLIADNASTDDTSSYCESLVKTHGNFRYLRRVENIGSIANFADAIDRVETEYLLILADDDYLLPGFLSEAITRLDADKELGAVAMQTVHINHHGEEIRLNPDSRWSFGRFSSEDFMKMWIEYGHFEWHSVVFRTAACKEIGGLDLEVGLPSDVDFQAQIFIRHPTLVIEKRAAVFSVHENQSSRSIGPKDAGGFARLARKFEHSAAGNPALRPLSLRLKNGVALHLSRMAWKCDNLRQLIKVVRVLLFELQRPGLAFLCISRFVFKVLGRQARSVNAVAYSPL